MSGVEDGVAPPDEGQQSVHESQEGQGPEEEQQRDPEFQEEMPPMSQQGTPMRTFAENNPIQMLMNVESLPFQVSPFKEV